MNIKFFVCLFLISFVSESAMALSTDKRPDYQKEYDAYLHDLQIIEQKGYAPKNPILEDDLAKMSSEKRIRLTSSSIYAPRKKYSEETDGDILLKFADNDSDKVEMPQSDAEVVRRVEIIRVPEEFREKYADVYAEETKHISSQNLVQGQDELQDTARDNAKIAEHNNPFRSLKEQKLGTSLYSPDEGYSKNAAVTKAYFEQQKRAYVAGDPIVIKKKNVEEKEDLPENSIESVSSSAAAQENIQNVDNLNLNVRNKRQSGKKYRNSRNGFSRSSRASKMFLE